MNRAAKGLAFELETILVAEDELLLAQNLQGDLSQLGYRVIGPAPNGQRALELARNERPDLALLDLRMPTMDGLTAARILKDEMGVPTVVISAYSDREDVDQSRDVGVFGYLLKPANVDALRVTIGVAWDRFCHERQLQGEVDEAHRKLEERKLVERAKGIIMQQRGVGEPEAMKLLQKRARDSRRPMAELARSVIESSELLGQDGN